jgi:23S rRNA (uridine2552-2'-O)-methyltransferase
MKVRVRTAKGRSVSSTRWLARQLNDPFVAEAQKRGYRSRAAFKLIEMADRHEFLKAGDRALDLGAAPGSWSQVALKRGCRVVAADINAMEALDGAEVHQIDILDNAKVDVFAAALGRTFDAVLSDMAAPATGHRGTDHLRVMALCEAALDLAVKVLKPGGTFLAKVLRGGTEADLTNRLKRGFAAVRHVKPKASRSDSSEMYVLATGFRSLDSP